MKALPAWATRPGRWIEGAAAVLSGNFGPRSGPQRLLQLALRALLLTLPLTTASGGGGCHVLSEP